MDNKKTCYLFFDFDGTIITWVTEKLPDGSEKKRLVLPESHLSSIRAAHDAGHKIFVCTGRSRGSFLALGKDWAPVFDLPWDGMIFGASDMWYQGERISVTYISREETLFWYEYCKNTKRIFYYNGTEKNILYDFRKELSDKELKELCSDLEKQLTENPITNMSSAPSALDVDLSKTALTVVHLATYTDVFAPGCDKGSAIKRFCELIGAPVEQTVCFGDSENDIDMFKACSMGVAMKYAPEKLKAVATYTAETEFGVSEGINRIFGI